jgi:hypothetical protein
MTLIVCVKFFTSTNYFLNVFTEFIVSLTTFGVVFWCDLLNNTIDTVGIISGSECGSWGRNDRRLLFACFTGSCVCGGGSGSRSRSSR